VTAAQSYLTFTGDVSRGLHVGQAMGPTTYGGLMYVVGWEVRHEKNRTVTRVGMSAVKP
jgi:hypothetical protein